MREYIYAKIEKERNLKNCHLINNSHLLVEQMLYDNIR